MLVVKNIHFLRAEIGQVHVSLELLLLLFFLMIINTLVPSDYKSCGQVLVILRHRNPIF